jgi:uncharacterized protein (UPF0335 family)
MRRREPQDLFLDYTPIGRKRPPVETGKTDTASILRHQAHARDEAVRFFDE